MLILKFGQFEQCCKTKQNEERTPNSNLGQFRGDARGKSKHGRWGGNPQGQRNVRQVTEETTDPNHANNDGFYVFSAWCSERKNIMEICWNLHQLEQIGGCFTCNSNRTNWLTFGVKTMQQIFLRLPVGHTEDEATKETEDFAYSVAREAVPDFLNKRARLTASAPRIITSDCNRLSGTIYKEVGNEPFRTFCFRKELLPTLLPECSL